MQIPGSLSSSLSDHSFLSNPHRPGEKSLFCKCLGLPSKLLNFCSREWRRLIKHPVLEFLVGRQSVPGSSSEGRPVQSGKLVATKLGAAGSAREHVLQVLHPEACSRGGGSLPVVRGRQGISGSGTPSRPAKSEPGLSSADHPRSGTV